MASHIPKWHRGYSKPVGYLTATTYNDVVVRLHLTPTLVQEHTNAWTTISVRQIGTVSTTVTREGLTDTRHTYELLQHITTGHPEPNESTYKASILIGNYVGREQEQDLFGNVAAPRTNLWCGRCWHDNIYGTGEGGVQIPQFMLGRYFSRIHNLEACRFCDAKFYTTEAIKLGPLDLRDPRLMMPAADDDDDERIEADIAQLRQAIHLYQNGDAEMRAMLLTPRTQQVAPIFSAIGCQALKEEVDRYLAPFGLGSVEYTRHPSDPTHTESYREEIVREAMKPSRVAAILAKHDFAGLMSSF
jgi:hypothetical protein